MPVFQSRLAWIMLGCFFACCFSGRSQTNPPTTNLVWCPSGSFIMGSPNTEPNRQSNEGPQLMVTLTDGFWISKYEMTQGEFESVYGLNPSKFTGDTNRPVEQVNWFDAMQFCVRLTEQERLLGRLPAGYVYRLPTEAEWEYAARAGTTTAYSFGDDYLTGDPYAWHVGDSGGTTHSVGTRLPNPWGLFDMHGNVAELCLDSFWNYPGGSVTNPVGVTTGTLKTFRAPAWDFGFVYARSATRFSYDANYGDDSVGFRVVLAKVKPGETWPNSRNPGAQRLGVTKKGSAVAVSAMPDIPGTYRLESSTDLKVWNSAMTVNAWNSSLSITNAITNQTRFFRAVSLTPMLRRPFLNVLVRFSDTIATTPHPRSWYEALFGTNYPALSHFFYHVSYGRIDVSETVTLDWLNLPQIKTNYTLFNGSYLEFDESKLLADIYPLLPSSIQLSNFFGVNIFCNADDGGSEGLSSWVNFPATAKPYLFGIPKGPIGFFCSIIPLRGGNQHVVSHEMGHSFGLDHSSGPYSTPYDSDWDFMSRGRNLNQPDPQFGPISVFGNAYHLMHVSWMPTNRVYVTSRGTNTLRIERLSDPATMDYLVAKVPIGSSQTHYYTVESRMYAGYDVSGVLPGEAVLIHQVDENRGATPGVFGSGDRRSQVIDPDNNGNPNDASAMWTPGETFVDSTNGVSVKVLSKDTTGFNVQIIVN